MRKASIGFATLVLGLAAAFGYAQAPVPFINQPLVPDAVAPGGPNFTLTVNGTGFVSKSTVNWNTTPLATTFVNGSQLTATVPAADIATASTAWVTVVNPAPGGGTSNVAFFTVTANIGNAIGFTVASSPPVGGYPWAVAVEDFNGDRKLDLAVANEGSDTVSILFGDGAGNFTAGPTLTAGNTPDAIVTGDFNNDGNPDLAVANYGWSQGGTVSIFLGDGTGNFTLAFSPGASYDDWSMVAGDFNGDGNLDLAVGNFGSYATILLGDGTGNFTLTSYAGTGYGPGQMAVGDFNGDGKLDIAVANSCGNDSSCQSTIGSVSILLGDGTGNFSPASSPAVGDWPTSVAAADFNGDGILDLAVANKHDNTASILLGDGTGNFSLASSSAAGGEPASAVTGDFNGDAIPDLAVADWEGTVSILLGDGTGNFTLASSVATGIQPWSLAAGDFNRDGKLDLVVPSVFTDTVSILLQAGPAATLSPASLTFVTQLLGTTSGPQTVTLTNTGGETLDITSIAATTNFSETNTCGSTLTAGASCSITVTFTPVGVGTLTGSITVTDSASNSPQTVPLTGTGTVATLLPGSLNFGVLRVGNSVTRTATLTNYSYRALNISAVQFLPPAAGDFSQTNTCGTSLPAQSSCAFSITFTPQAKGLRKSTMGVIDNGGGGPQKVALSGTGE